MGRSGLRRYLKAELKRRSVTYTDLAWRLNDHGFEGQTEESVNSKLVRDTFAVTFFLALLGVWGVEGVTLTNL